MRPGFLLAGTQGMTSCYRRHHIILKVAAIVGIGITAAMLRLSQVKRTQAQQPQPYGHYTAPQILDRTLLLLPPTIPEVAESQLTAHPQQEIDRRRIPERHWIIDCTDVANHQLASIDWEADTGRLFRIMRNRNYLPHYRGHALSEQHVIQNARTYLILADHSSALSAWRLEDRPRHVFGKWSLRWRAGEERADVLIDDLAGDMTYMEIAHQDAAE